MKPVARKPTWNRTRKGKVPKICCFKKAMILLTVPVNFHAQLMSILRNPSSTRFSLENSLRVERSKWKRKKQIRPTVSVIIVIRILTVNMMRMPSLPIKMLECVQNQEQLLMPI